MEELFMIHERVQIEPIAQTIIEKMALDFSRFWKRFDFEVGEIHIPQHRPGLDRLLVVPEGLTKMRAIECCQGMFRTSRWTNDLDKIVSENQRTSNHCSYAIWVREGIEADEEFKNQSASDLEAINHSGITLLERLVYEIKYYQETGQNLDINSITLCTGSRGWVSGVPHVCCRSGEVHIDWCHLTARGNGLRSREVVA